MQQFARVLDNRFSEPQVQGGGRKSQGPGPIEMEFDIERMKDELFRLSEKFQKEMSQHREDTDNVVLKLMEKIEGVTQAPPDLIASHQQAHKAGGSVSEPPVKQETIVNILVRIELLENEMRTQKNLSAFGAPPQTNGHVSSKKKAISSSKMFALEHASSIVSESSQEVN